MKNFKSKSILDWQRLILVITALFLFVGIAAWFSSPREEDPRLKDREGIVKIVFPGATSEDVRRLVLNPLEDELAQIEGIKTLVTKGRAEFGLVEISLKDSVAQNSDIDSTWKKVQDAIDRAKKKYPTAVLEPELDRDLFDQDAVFLAITGGKDRLELLPLVKELKDRLISISVVKKINLVASPGEQLTIFLSDEISRRLGISFVQLLGQMKAGNASTPSGFVRIGDRKVNILTNSFFKSHEELVQFPIGLKSGEIVTLGSIAKVEKTNELPESEQMRYNGQEAIGIGVVPEKGINLQKFGAEVRQVVAQFQESQKGKEPKIEIHEVNFQPEYVTERINEIGFKLALAIILVGGALLLMLGFRAGIIVALQVPIVTIISFGFFYNTGGILHQISLVAFILAIGLLVDNVIVMVDGIQEKLDRGLTSKKALQETINEFWLPLAAGTLTSVAAFVPILLAQGGPSDFVRSIGEVASITLIISYFFSLFVTPIFAAMFLKKGASRQWKFLDPFGKKIGTFVTNFPKTIIISSLVLVGISGYGFLSVKKQFFPMADRNQVIVDLQMPEGTHFKTTLEQAKKIEQALSEDKRIISYTTLVGRGVPLFYYNLPLHPNASHVAQIIVRTKDAIEAKEFKRDTEEKLKSLVPYGVLIVKEIAQGPPVDAPIEIRIESHNLEKMRDVSQKILQDVRFLPGVTEARSDLGIGTINIKYTINDSIGENFGVTRSDVSGVLLSRTRGLPVTDYRGDRDNYQIVVKSTQGEESSRVELGNAYLGQTRTKDLKVDTFTNQMVEMLPSVVHYRNQVPTITILTELEDGYGENEVADKVKNVLAKYQNSDPEITIGFGGASSEAAEANKSIFLALPAGIFLLLLALLIEFNSFRRVGIILITIPLCAVGTVPGLLLSHSSFGFMTLLGCLALAGTVIHNGIFLLDFIDSKVSEGVELNSAIIQGIQRRTRPIILTAVATIVELLPLTVTRSTMWPPFAWAIISGLTISTLLTLIVVPALYKLAFQNTYKNLKPVLAMSVFLIAILLHPSLFSQNARTSAKKMNLQDIIEKSLTSPNSLSEMAKANSVYHMSQASFRNTYFPKLGGELSFKNRDRDLHSSTPFGSLRQGEKKYWEGGLEVSQSLFDPAQMLYAHPSVEKNKEASELEVAYKLKDYQYKGIKLYLDIQEIIIKKKALEEFLANLKVRHTEFRRLLEIGRLGEADILNVQLGMDDAKIFIDELEEKEKFLSKLLAASLGEDDFLALESVPIKLPNFVKIPDFNLEEREDLKALKAQIQAFGLQSQSYKAENFPKVQAFFSHTYTTQEQVVEKNWNTFGIRFTWIGFDGGARYSQSRSFEEKKHSAYHTLRGSELSIRADYDDAKNMLEKKSQEFKSRTISVLDAQKIVKLESQRLNEGRSSVSDVLYAEEIFRDRKEKTALCVIAWYKEWFRLQAALGVSPSLP